MQNVTSVLKNITILNTVGDAAVNAVNGVAVDSRLVKSGYVFVAISGTATDGHLHIDSAIANGAVIIVCEKLPQNINSHICYIQVANTTKVVGVISHNFYNLPSTQIKLVGVTGTNGKTTVATVLYNLFTNLGYACGLVSTVENRINGKVLNATHTTPDAVSLNKLLAQMVKEGCEYVFMECSSHAIHQQRIGGLQFAGALFTNLTHDHLDYHGNINEYAAAKRLFFDKLASTAFAITNTDDKWGNFMVEKTKAIVKTYAIKQPATYKGKILDNALTGLQMMVNQHEVHFKLIGEFNAYNLLAVYGAAVSLGANENEVLVALSQLAGAEGRFDVVAGDNNVLAIVDYAHTPDALENVLSTINNLAKGNENIITVVGCGGDRDKTKRPVMARVACQHSSKTILTSDNPRTENAATILQEMEAGLEAADKRKVITIEDRKQAIKTAVMMAEPNDIILIAGKGHEKYQDIMGVKHPFDDKQIVKEFLLKN